MSLITISANNIFQKEVIGKVRTAQEDSHDMATDTPNGDVFVVCDGMGGHVGGKQASLIAVHSIIEYLEKEKYPNPTRALSQALQFANMQILGYANEHPELQGMGTTACILLLQDYKAYIAHVGDSRIYLYLGKEKQLHRLTKDHSYVQTLVDAGEISYEQAEEHPNKNRILKALGIKSELRPTIIVQPIRPKNGDVFLICSDGLNGMISDSVIENVLSSNATIEQKGESLINLALEEGGLDNITLQLIQISNSPHKNRAYISFNPYSRPSSSSNTHRLRKPLIAVLIIVLCVIGVGIARYYANKKSQEQKLETLRGERDKAMEDYRSLDKQLLQQEAEYEKTKETTEQAKQSLDKNPNNKDLKSAYESLTSIYENAKSELGTLRKRANYARQKADSLKNRFNSDSINIANPKHKSK